ncbi:ShlB/FhaC/HecB family hemolysin secretion/activation protein [Sphingomonas sp. RB3P16]|uniref:ShlB/FhaC/HecB family hemolysin secretion/activation protein n=1 Tax=Parasphingomonas frigoris TaxID=3096163 RepID=UPI002FC6CF13
MTGLFAGGRAHAACTDGQAPPIRSVQVIGSTLESNTLATAYAAQIGQPDTKTAHKAIAKSIAAAYEHSDIALYDVSPRAARQCGIVEIAVMEGHVADATVSGTLDPAVMRLIHRYLAAITAERPLHISTLQRYVSLIREVAGVRSSVEFSQTQQPGAVRLVVTSAQSRGRLGYAIDNRGSEVVGTVQAQLFGSLYGVLQGGDQLDASVIATQYPKRLLGLSASYSAPLGSAGTRWSISVGRSRTELAEYYYGSDTTVIVGNLGLPIVRSYSTNASIGVDLRHSVGRTEFFGYELLTARGWSIGPTASFGTATRRSEVAISVTSSIGALRRSSEFVYLTPVRKNRRVTAQAIVHRRVGQQVKLRVKGVAQFGTRNLPATEQLGLGGSDFGRAFANGFVAGDSGYAISGEVALRLGRKTNWATMSNEAYAFIDGGHLTYHDPLSSIADSERLMSSGMGLRLGLGASTTLSVEAATGTARLFGTDKNYRRLSIGLKGAIL